MSVARVIRKDKSKLVMEKFKVYHDNILSNIFLCVDIETTGLDQKAPTAGILEVYYKVMDTSSGKPVKILEDYDIFYHPNWIDTKDIHQIEEKEFEGKKMFVEREDFKLRLRALMFMCCEADDPITFMAHYSPFEFKWLTEFLGFTEEEKNKLLNIKTCDTRYIAKFLFPEESHSLINLCNKYDIKQPVGQHDFHRADQDVNAMWELYTKLREEIPDEDCEEYDPSIYAFNFKEEENSHD